MWRVRVARRMYFYVKHKGFRHGQVFSMDVRYRVCYLADSYGNRTNSVMHLCAAIAGLVLGSTLIVIIKCINKRMEIEAKRDD